MKFKVGDIIKHSDFTYTGVIINIIDKIYYEVQWSDMPNLWTREIYKVEKDFRLLTPLEKVLK